VKISGPRVPDNTCAALTVEQTQVSDVAVSPAKEIELLSAHWDDGFATDVTKEVSSLLKPELQEFFAAPEWLLRGPLTGVKTLGIRFQFACREFVLDAWEPNPISYAILKTYAETVIAGERWNGPVYATDEDAETMQNITPVSNSDVVVVNALYGYGNDFSNVTDKVRDLLATGAPLFVVSDGMFNVTPDASDRRLLLTYLYRGKRATVQIRKMGEFSISFLAETAEAGFQAGEYFSDPDYFRPDKRFFKFQ
jgi:hypothetical protein